MNACKTQSEVSSGLGAKDNHSGRKIWDDVGLFDSDLLPSVPTVANSGHITSIMSVRSLIPINKGAAIITFLYL